MTQRTKDELLTEIAVYINDNMVGDNTPAELRTVLSDMVDSLVASGGLAVGENWAGKLLNRAVAARAKNPTESSQLIGAKPWIVLAGAWAPNTAYTLNTLRSNGGKAYICIQAGTSAASGGPTGTTPGIRITDNTVQWGYYVGTVGDRVSNFGNVYEIVTAGVPATSGTGPTGLGSAITDGSITWAYVDKQTAPVITVSSSHNGALTTISAVPGSMAGYVDGSQPFRLTGGLPATSGIGGNVMQCVNVAPAGGNLSGTYSFFYNGVSTLLRGAKLELQVWMGTYHPQLFTIDDQYVDYMLPSPTSGTYYITLDFTNVFSNGTTSKARKIMLEADDVFYQMACAPADKFYYPVEPGDFSCVMVGDSQVIGSGDTFRTMAVFSIQLKNLLGFPDMMLCGIGQTGMVAAGAATKYAGHAITDTQNLDAFRPVGAIFIQCSQNDSPNGATLAAESLALFQAYRTAFPSVPIFVLGNITGSGITLATVQTNEALVAGSVASMRAGGDLLIHMIPAANDVNGPWTINSDISADTAHLNDQGHTAYAKRAASYVYKILADNA